MVSRLHAKTNQIGKILNNLEKYNYLMKDGDIRTPTTPGSITKSILGKTSPTSPRADNMIHRPLFGPERCVLDKNLCSKIEEMSDNKVVDENASSIPEQAQSIDNNEPKQEQTETKISDNDNSADEGSMIVDNIEE